VSRFAAAVVLGLAAAALSACGGGGAETATDTTALHQATTEPPPVLTAADCRELTRAVRRAIGAAGGSAQMRLHRTAQPGPRLSGCFYNGAGAHVSFRIDTAKDSHQRFSYRNEEAIQFSFDTPQRRPRDVPGVGDPGANFHGATWTPANREMLAVRGNRLLILDLYVMGASSGASKRAAAGLARRVYGVSASA
jgi:hypothetical protein